MFGEGGHDAAIKTMLVTSPRSVAGAPPGDGRS